MRKNILLFLSILSTIIFCNHSFAQFSKLYDFEGATNGSNPMSSLVTDGTYLYGMTNSGGVNNTGVIFKVKTDGTGYLKLLDFTGTNGSNPNGSLMISNGNLYGMTSFGGLFNAGIIFKIKTDGTGFADLFEFGSLGSTDGFNPFGTLLFDGTYLYGMAMYGGTSNKGIIFKIKTDGNNYSILLNFSGSNGANPLGSLISDGSYLYGTTRNGGTKNLGVLFKVTTDGTGYSRIVDFDSTHGYHPMETLYTDTISIYGMTYKGGANKVGEIFKVKNDGTIFTPLYPLTGNLNSYTPRGSLLAIGNYFYTTTSWGGSYSSGNVFKIKNDGTGYTSLRVFSGGSYGENPIGPLTFDGTKIYGAVGGGKYYAGMIFKENSDGSNFLKIYDFVVGLNGGNPAATLTSDGTWLYGTAYNGGINAAGTAFKVKFDGTSFTKLHDFGLGTDGKFPQSAIIYSYYYLYGSTANGGTNGYGMIYKMALDGSSYMTIMDFISPIDGKFPAGDLFTDGTYLYGATGNGGTNGLGNLYKLKNDGTGGIIRMFDFDTSSGKNPIGSLVSDGTYLYGICENGGANKFGLIFKIKKDGTGYSKLYEFDSTYGGFANGTLNVSGNDLYATMSNGGNKNEGIIIKLKSDGTGFTKVHEFGGYSDGAYPQGALNYDGNYFYGITESGGRYQAGIIFKIKPDGSGYNKAYDFNGDDGNSPSGTLLLNANIFYGATYMGGKFDQGTIFKYQKCSTSVSNNQSISLCSGKSINIGFHEHKISGNYTDTTDSYMGCDSIVHTQLTVISVDTTVTLMHSSLVSNATSANYQWITCSDSTILPGSTGKTFAPTFNGKFAVIVTINGCSDTSACYSITTAGIDEPSVNERFQIAPNPSTGVVKVMSKNNFLGRNLELKIQNNLGQTIYSGTLNQSNQLFEVDLSDAPKGLYFVQINDGERIITRKFVKE